MTHQIQPSLKDLLEDAYTTLSAASLAACRENYNVTLCTCIIDALSSIKSAQQSFPAAEPAQPVDEIDRCRHCGSTKDPWFSRSLPMGYFCQDCGKEV